MSASDAITVDNASATSPQKFLMGGAYILDASGTFGAGTVRAQVLARDNTTWVDIPNSTLSANGESVKLFLAPGQYRIAIAGGATAIFAALTRIANG